MALARHRQLQTAPFRAFARSWRFQIHIMEDGSVRMFSRRAEDWMARTNGHQPIAPMLKDSVRQIETPQGSKR